MLYLLCCSIRLSVHLFVRSSDQILLPWYVVNGLNNFGNFLMRPFLYDADFCIEHDVLLHTFTAAKLIVN